MKEGLPENGGDRIHCEKPQALPSNIPPQERSETSVPDLASEREGDARWKTWETVFTNAKAGMGGVDKEKVQKVVYEMSEGSAHFKNEERKQKQVDAKIAAMKKRAAVLSTAELNGHTRATDADVAALHASRDLTRTWIVVDMDAFYASVEERDNPFLKTKPMAVGGMGMICTANYVARRFGVRSAMPGFIAVKLCPDLVFVKPNFNKYKAASEAVQPILKDYDPAASSYSLDEAFLDVTDYCAAHAVSGGDVAAEIRRRVKEATSLTCSCGVAPNSMLAKICADFNKPDGQCVLPPYLDAITNFMSVLPIRKVPGIGKVQQQTLNALGIETCATLLEKRGLLHALFTPTAYGFYLSASLGLGSTEHGEPAGEGEVGRKGISCERTFHAISSKADLEAKCEELTKHLAEEMEEKGLKGKTLTLKLKDTAFAVRTRAVTLLQYTNSATTILQAALRLLHAEMPIEIRLMGIRMANFLEVKASPNQKTLATFVQLRPRTARPSEHEVASESARHSKPEAASECARPSEPEVAPESARRSEGEVASESAGNHTSWEASRGIGEKDVPAMGARGIEPDRILHGGSQPSTDAGPESAAPSQSLELSLRDWGCPNQATPSSSNAASFGDWTAGHPLSANPSAPNPQTPSLGGNELGAHTLTHYHSGVSVTGPRAKSMSPPDGGFGSGFRAHSATPSDPGSLTCQDAGGAAPVSCAPPGELNHQEGGGDAPASLPFLPYNPYGEGFSGWQPGWTGRGMCGRHPDASHTVVADGEPGERGEHPEGPRGSSGPSGAKRKAARTWACRLCTFAENDPAWLRCQICDTVKGSTVASLPASDAGGALAAGGSHTRTGAHFPAVGGGGARAPEALRPPSRLRRASSDGEGPGARASCTGGRAAQAAAPDPPTSGVARSATDNGAGGELPHGPSASPAWARVQGPSGGEDMWRCARCGHVASVAEKGEHDDHHLALRLHEEQGGGAVGKRSLSGVVPSGPAKRRKGSAGRAQTLHSFLQRSQA